MCLHGVKAQEGAGLGGVGPARRGRAGQRWGERREPRSPAGAGVPTGSGGSGHCAGAERGCPGARGSLQTGRKLRGAPAVAARRLAGQGRCAEPGQVRSGRGGHGEGRGGVPATAGASRYRESRGHQREEAQDQRPRKVRRARERRDGASAASV